MDEMNEHGGSEVGSGEMEAAERWLRIAALQDQVREAHGGHLTLCPGNPQTTAEEYERAWADLAAAGEEMPVPIGLQLIGRGKRLPTHPRDLPAGEVSERLERLIRDLAGINIVMTGTDHLSDAELYEKLVVEVLPTAIIRDAGESLMHFRHLDIREFCGETEEDCHELYLRYYAERAYLETFYPEMIDDLPTGPRPPYDRDARIGLDAVLEERLGPTGAVKMEPDLLSVSYITRFPGTWENFGEDGPYDCPGEEEPT